MKNLYDIRKLILACLFVAMGLLLPQAFHWFKMSSFIFLPMHIPVLLCGFICGPYLGLLCGLIVPVLSSLLTGMPPLYPVASYMACELAAYGFFSGFLYSRFKLHKVAIYYALVGALLLGRMVLGISQALLLGFGKFAFAPFVTSAFVTAFPGILVQLIIIPAIVVAINKSPVGGILD